MDLKSAISKILDEEVKSGQIFDSHFVILFLLKKKSDDYLRFFHDEFRNGENLTGKDCQTITYHGIIAQKIASFEGAKIEKIGRSISQNIHGEFSDCECWKKL